MRSKEIYIVANKDEIIANARQKYGKGEKARHIADFAIRLDALMYDKGKAQETMAHDLNISVGAISNYRNGKAEPTMENLIKIAAYLGVDCHYLITGIKATNAQNSTFGLQQDAIDWLTDAVNGKKLEELEVINAFFRAGVVDLVLFGAVQYLLGSEKSFTLRQTVNGINSETTCDGEVAKHLSRCIAQEDYSLALDEVANTMKYGNAWHRKRRKENAPDEFLRAFEQEDEADGSEN